MGAPGEGSSAGSLYQCRPDAGRCLPVSLSGESPGREPGGVASRHRRGIEAGPTTPGLPAFLQTNIMVPTGSNYTSKYLGMTLATDPTNGKFLVRILCSVISEPGKLNARKQIDKKKEKNGLKVI